jgi:hypothetical protein
MSRLGSDEVGVRLARSSRRSSMTWNALLAAGAAKEKS